VADQAYKRITNEDGIFNTHIVYVETVPGTKTTKRLTRLVRIDLDGDNRVEITDGTSLVLTPRTDGNSELVACAEINRSGTSALVVNVRTGAVRPLLTPGMLRALAARHGGRPVQMSYAPRLSPDGGKAVLAVAIGGNSAICEVDHETSTVKQLTELRFIDTSPSYSPDGRYILFTSDRAGREAIYRMNADGSNVKRLSQGEGKYSQPVCSPRGDLIAFTKQYRGRFYIGVMKIDGTDERLIASGDVVEAPSWAPNGRYVIYAVTRGSQSRIAITDITGRYTRFIITKYDASSPTWLPALFIH
jgi:TolB protein